MSTPSQRISSAEIRRRFNSGAYLQRTADGELRAEVRKSRPAPGAANQPQGTVSQYVALYEGEVKVAGVHRYLRPDGTIGGRGLPDPKWLFEGGVVYYC